MFRNKNLFTLFITMIVVMIGFGIIIPIMPFYMQKFGAGGTELGMLMAIFSIMQFLFSPFWGEMSDRYGRKKILMIGVLGNAISLLMLGLAPNMELIFLSRALGGAISAATLPTAMAYISDSTTHDERGAGMGVIGAAMGVGMVLGPGIGGWLSGHSLATPFFLAALISLVALALIWLILPESLAVEHRASGARKFSGPQLKVLWGALFGPLGFLLVQAFLVNFALANFEGIFGLFADKRYGYGPAQVGTIMMVVGIISSLVQMLLTGPATRKLGEETVIKLSLVASAVGFILMVLAPNNILVLLTVAFFVFANSMLRPAILSISSKKAQGGQGMALGLNNAYQSLGRVVGPLWAGLMFDFHITLPYISAAVIMLVAFAWAMLVKDAPAEQIPAAPLTSRVGDD